MILEKLKSIQILNNDLFFLNIALKCRPLRLCILKINKHSFIAAGLLLLELFGQVHEGHIAHGNLDVFAAYWSEHSFDVVEEVFPFDGLVV